MMSADMAARATGKAAIDDLVAVKSEVIPVYLTGQPNH
jgi:hypothetical protein